MITFIQPKENVPNRRETENASNHRC